MNDHLKSEEYNKDIRRSKLNTFTFTKSGCKSDLIIDDELSIHKVNPFSENIFRKSIKENNNLVSEGASPLNFTKNSEKQIANVIVDNISVNKNSEKIAADETPLVKKNCEEIQQNDDQELSFENKNNLEAEKKFTNISVINPIEDITYKKESFEGGIANTKNNMINNSPTDLFCSSIKVNIINCENKNSHIKNKEVKFKEDTKKIKSDSHKSPVKKEKSLIVSKNDNKKNLDISHSNINCVQNKKVNQNYLDRLAMPVIRQKGKVEIDKSLEFRKSSKPDILENRASKNPIPYKNRNTDTTNNALFKNKINLKEESQINEWMLKEIKESESDENNDCNNENAENFYPIKVAIRFKPITDEVRNNESYNDNIIFQKLDETSVLIRNNSTQKNMTFNFDYIYDFKVTQEQIYNNLAKESINDVLKGFNATIFTYGESGSGKTYTLFGKDYKGKEKKGIVSRGIYDIFKFIEAEENKDIQFQLKLSMLEIYKEKIYDLLEPETHSNDLKIKNDKSNGLIVVQNLKQEYIVDFESFYTFLDFALQSRAVLDTKLNKNTSRSHVMLILEVIQYFPNDTSIRGVLNVVDLAGSEKVSKTGASGIQLEQGIKINLGLSTISNVINHLIEGKMYIPYRDSKITRILQDSLGGNSKCTMIVTCNSHSKYVEETISSLQFASKVKNVKNRPKVNVQLSRNELEAKVLMLENQLKEAKYKITSLQSKINELINADQFLENQGGSNN